MPKVVIGTIVALVVYVLLFVLASFNKDAVWTIPGGTVYLLFIYAAIGCLGMVLVLPLLFWKKDKS
jgi:uncharacterized membrane protein (DUF485 family)